MARKSLALTYLLWFFGGYFGLHHLYLGRYKQAFLWGCFPGGYLGAGWFRDIWRIPEYVRDANADPKYMADLADKMRKLKKPPFSIVRGLGQMVVGNVFGMLISIAPPAPDDEMGPGIDFSLAVNLLAPAFSAIGIWIVGNIGREQGSIKPVLVGCYALAAPYLFDYVGFSVVTLAGIVAFHWKSKKWRRAVKESRSFCANFSLVFLCWGIYSSVWCSYAYYNMHIVTKDGDVVKLRDAVSNFVRSPAFQQFSENSKLLYQHAMEHGFGSAWKRLIESLDPLGEINALRVLGLGSGASQAEVKSRYRELSKKWHPDRYLDEQEKAIAHDRFVEIQAAYETLSSIIAKRREINRSSNLDEPGA